MTYVYALLLGAMCVTQTVYGENAKTAPAHVEAPTPVPPQARKTLPAPSQDPSVALQNDVDFLQKQYEKLGGQKGYDETAAIFLHQVAPLFDHVRILVGRIYGAKNAVRDTQDQIAALQAQLQKEQSAVRDLESQTSAVVVHIKETLKKVSDMPVSAPQSYPERCGIMTQEKEVQGEGFETVHGIVEKFNRKWVLSFADQSASDGLRRLPLDDKVGLVGSTDHNAGLLVTGFTPANMYVTGLFNPKTGTIMCVSNPQPVPEKAQGQNVAQPGEAKEPQPTPPATKPAKGKKQPKSPAPQPVKIVSAPPVQVASQGAPQGMQQGVFEDVAPQGEVASSGPAPAATAPPAPTPSATPKGVTRKISG